jgi:5-methylcytosine-specific restriction protein A
MHAAWREGLDQEAPGQRLRLQGRLAAQVLKRDGYVCQLRYPGCLGRASQVDHIVQPEAGGTDELENLRAVCRRCHATRTGRQGALAKQRKERR